MQIIPLLRKEAATKKNIFLPLFQKEPPEDTNFFLHLPIHAKNAVKELYKKEFKGEEGETKSVWFPKGSISRVRLFGRGEKQKWNRHKAPLMARRFVQYAKGERILEFATPFESEPGMSKKEVASMFATNALLANFEFTAYKEKPESGWPEVKTICLGVEKEELEEIRQGIKEGLIIGEEINHCRNLVNTPGGDITPQGLAKAASDHLPKFGVSVKILDEKKMKELGMGGILGVSKGSSEKPCLIVMEYKPSKTISRKPLLLVGKGVTFDTGGLNLKPEQAILQMHMDMSGGAAVLHGIAAIARLKLPLHAIGLIPAVENMPSGTSYRPGDILKMHSGKTVEVLNTDAEGRIILADALSFALRYKPGLIVDFATLTGAAHVALGSYCSALFTNKENLESKLREIGEKSGDYVWPLPLWQEYLQDIKGTFADLANVGKQDRYGGAIHGAKFLEQFVKDTPWAHLDIAPRMTTIESDYLAKGASGVGVRYIVELAKAYPGMKIFIEN